MEHATQTSTTASLEEIKHRFEQWRQARPKGRSRIPAELWQAGIDLIGPTYSINKVASGLKLNHQELKHRYLAQHPDSLPTPPAKPRFVEIPCTPPVGNISEYVLEVEDGHGRKLKLTVRDEGRGLDVPALARGLWEATK